jgi:hypothetical protein
MAYVSKDESSVGINYFEYNVEKKADWKTRLQRLGIVLLDILLAVILVATIDGMLLLISFCGFALVFAILTFFLYKRTQIEFEYEINAGEFTMSKVYGGRTRKQILSHKISSFHHFAPYTEENFKNATKNEEIKKFFCISSPDAIDQFFGIFTDENGVKTAVIFQAPKKAVSIIKFYNSAATKLQ